MDSASREYFERRAKEELAACWAAADPRAAKSHRELAEHYRSLAEGSATPKFRQPAPLESGTVSSDFLIVP